MTNPDEHLSPSFLNILGPEDLADRLAALRPALFLDYDGTLVPIAPRPDLAVLSDIHRDKLRHVAKFCPVAVVSGRDLDDVRRLVGVDGIVYAGSHGFDILAPSGRHRMGEEFRPSLERAGAALDRALSGIPGALVEHKRYALAIHYRQVPVERRQEIEEVVRAVAAGEPELRRTGGKELFELRPKLPWDKGSAVTHLIETEKLGGCMPVYLGDDLTDEDAFHALRGQGIGILVGHHGHATAAVALLPDVPAVWRFLDGLATRLERGG